METIRKFSNGFCNFMKIYVYLKIRLQEKRILWLKNI